MNACGGFFANAVTSGRHARVLGLVQGNRVFQQLQDALKLGVVCAGRIWQGAVFRKFGFELLALRYVYYNYGSVSNVNTTSDRYRSDLQFYKLVEALANHEVD